MKSLATILAARALLALASGEASASYSMRISQVYGGRGDVSTPTYSQDYVEILNSSVYGTIDTSGWTLEYGSPSGNWGSTPADIFVFPPGTSVPPCGYLLVAMTPGTAAGSVALPAPDFIGTLAMDTTSGKVALFNAVNPNTPCTHEVGMIDHVGYGASVCVEFNPVGAPSITTGAVRKEAGMTDTDNNLLDFTIVAAPVPRNSAAGPSYYCLTSPTRPSTWGQLKSIYR